MVGKQAFSNNEPTCQFSLMLYKSVKISYLLFQSFFFQQCLIFTTMSSTRISSKTRSKSSMSLCLNQRTLERDICTPFWTAKLTPSSLCSAKVSQVYADATIDIYIPCLHNKQVAALGKCRNNGRDGRETLSVNDRFVGTQKLSNVAFEIHVDIDGAIETRRAA